MLVIPVQAWGQVPEVGPCVPCDTLFATTGGSDGLLFTIDVESNNDVIEPMHGRWILWQQLAAAERCKSRNRIDTEIMQS